MRRTVAALLAISLTACTSGSLEQALDLKVAVSSPRFADNDPHDWSGRTPWHYPVHGIDVAKYQGNIDWPKAREAGVSFAFIKATEGGDRLDERFRANWEAARRAGIPRGAYHFFYFCRPAFEQALWFKKNVPVERNALPPVLDMEWNHKSPTCTFRPGPEAVRKEMDVFLRQLERHYGKRPIIYTTVDFYEENQLWKIRGHPFWLRSVAGHPSQKYGEQDWTFWQYTGTGVVPGIRGDTDINAFRGSEADWRRWVAANTR